MTKENCIRLLKLYKEQGRTAAYEDMRAHILKCKKFRDDPILEELKPKEVKTDGKKPKR